jgi:hypothetical protein
MEMLSEILPRLSLQHQQALSWFVEHAGQTVGWPAPIAGNLLLATKAKGIYKPAWSEYALSIKQTLKSPYPDRDPVTRPDGTWRYDYFQEGEAESGNRNYTNRGLTNCIRDRIPVGVIRQVSNRRPVRYQVLGVALPVRWEDGYFLLEGFGVSGFSHTVHTAAEGGNPLFVELENEPPDEFQPQSLLDARKRVLRAIVQRRGQREFRSQLIRAYSERCAVTGDDVLDALEAAHIALSRPGNEPSPEWNSAPS